MVQLGKSLVLGQGVSQGRAVEPAVGQFSPISLGKGFGALLRFRQVGREARVLRSAIQLAEIPLRPFGFESGCVHG